MEGTEDINSQNEKVKLLEQAFDSFEKGRLDNVVYYLNAAGEIELRDKVLEVEAYECIKSILDNSPLLDSDSGSDIKAYIRGSVTHRPYNVCIVAEKYGLISKIYYVALMKIIAVAFEYSGDSLFNASRLYESLGDIGKADELLKTARDLQAHDVYPTEEEQDESLVRNKSVMIDALRVFQQEIGNDSIMLIDVDKSINDVKLDISQKIAGSKAGI